MALKFNVKDRAAEVARDHRGGSMEWGIEDALRDAIKAARAEALELAREKAKLYGRAGSSALDTLIQSLEKLPPP